MKKIVIIGAGFAGLTVALGLEKRLKGENFEITLIDKNKFQLFTPNLFRTAAKDEELVDNENLKNAVTLPYAQILKKSSIYFIHGEAVGINVEHQQVLMAARRVNYDYLILAKGSTSNYFGILGAEKFSLPLKSFTDALRIRNSIEFAVQQHRTDVHKKNLRIVIAGGGYTGIEMAGELPKFLDFLAWKNNYPREKIEIEVISSSGRLVEGFDNEVSRDVYNRLSELGVRINLSTRISEIDEHFVKTLVGEKVAYDVLIWTAGIKSPPLACDFKLSADNYNRICVNEYLQVNLPQATIERSRGIFALGDMAGALNESNQQVPKSAQDALDQAKYLVYALPYFIKNQKPPKTYKPKSHGFIINVGGKWAAMSYGKFYLKGYLAYLADQMAHLQYYASVVGYFKAIKCIFFQMNIFGRNG